MLFTVYPVIGARNEPRQRCRFPPTLLNTEDGLMQAFPDADEVCGEWSW